MEVDMRCLLPGQSPIRVLVTRSDVAHSFRLPNLGIKVDAFPRKITEVVVYSKRYGVDFGFCREICGIEHSKIPIVVEFVPQLYFDC